MEPHLRLSPGQEALTPAQEEEARRFAQERIAAQLSTELVEEPETERLLQQAYAVAGLSPPQRMVWLDGPHHLVAVLASESVGASLGASVWPSVAAILWPSVWPSVRANVGDSVQDRVVSIVWNGVEEGVWGSTMSGVYTSLTASVRASVEDRVSPSLSASLRDGVRAYVKASQLAFFRFFDEYLAPNAGQALAHFNEQVSGYWLGREAALLVRRPLLLTRDSEGRLHNPSGKCLAYSDGWGISAWHGVQVSEQVILAPETLTRENFLNEQNVEVRRVIQERMGSRFVPELGGVVLDSSPRGTLYEVQLPEDDPERVARYVQVQDASTERQYFLRVPPTIQTAAEAVAWSFQLTVEEYHPRHET